MLLQLSCQDQALQISECAIGVAGGLVGCFDSLGLSPGSKMVGIKNGCLSDWKESPHFTRPNSIDHRIL